MKVAVIRSNRKTVAIQVNSDLSVTEELRVVLQRKTLKRFLKRRKPDDYIISIITVLSPSSSYCIITTSTKFLEA